MMLDSNHASVVIGVILGRIDGKIIDISNCFPLNLKSSQKGAKDDADENKKDKSGEPVYDIDIDYLKKMLKFHKTLNDSEAILGVYISSTELNALSMTIITYFRDLFISHQVRSPLQSPIVLTFDPELQNNKLDIKILNIYSYYLDACPLFSELPYEFNIKDIKNFG